MKNKKLLVLIIAAALIAVIVIVGFNLSEPEDDYDYEYDESSQDFDEDEIVGTDIDGREIDDQSFYGTWIADSVEAQLAFGDFQITFNEDGTYTAVITEEDISGTWTREGERVILSDNILECDFKYTADGELRLTYEDGTIICHR